ncbi:hypothetical protein GCM10020229_28440 [Kitasatospora albolonga]
MQGGGAQVGQHALRVGGAGEVDGVHGFGGEQVSAGRRRPAWWESTWVWEPAPRPQERRPAVP